MRICLLVALSSSACTPRSGTLHGLVQRRSTGKPYASVVVTARSAARPDEQNIAVTDGSGLYRLSSLSPGVYALRFERVGAAPLREEGLVVCSGRTLRLNVVLDDADDLAPESSEVTAAGAPSQGVTVGADFIRAIAVVRPQHGMRSLFLLDMPPGQGSRHPSWAHPYAPMVRPTGEPHPVHEFVR